MNSNRSYYINQIKDLSTNFDDDTASKIISEMKENIFDFQGLKKLYDLLDGRCLRRQRNQRLLKCQKKNSHTTQKHH